MGPGESGALAGCPGTFLSTVCLRMGSTDNADQVAFGVSHRLIGNSANKFASVLSAKLESTGPSLASPQLLHNFGCLRLLRVWNQEFHD